MLALDVGVVAAAFLFVRAPLVFGAHPFGLALVAALPSRVWLAFVGALLGAMSLGEGGVIYAMSATIIVSLRIIISGPGRRTEAHSVFGEGILLRMSVAVIGGFIAAVYELLLSGVEMRSVLFGVAMIILPPLLALGFSGVLGAVAEPFSLFTSDTALERLRKSDGLVLMRISLLLFLFSLAFCMRGYSALGISVGYLFSSGAALICARRFGAVGGAAVGFVCAIALSGTYSGAFMLAGLVAGVLSGFGVLYSAVFGGVALTAFSAYVGGVLGVTSTLPEYATAAALVFPIIKKIKPYLQKSEPKDIDRCAIDMVGTMALAYKSSPRALGRLVPAALSSVSSSAGAFMSGSPGLEELRLLVFGVVKQHLPNAENDENINKIATKLYNKEGISKKDLVYLGVSEDEIFSILTDIKRMHDSLVFSSSPAVSGLRLFGNIINEAASVESGEFSMNETATDALEAALSAGGFSDFTARVFGHRRRHVILAGRDEDGALITSPKLRSVIEGALDGRFGAPEYFRRGNMALMECSECRRYSVSYASVGAVGAGGGVSGDTARKIQTESNMFYALISDGMGSGESARRCSEFVASFFAATLTLTPPGESVMHLLNSYLRDGREECSATVDLFSFDLYNKEAVFLKSGGAPSYVKRGSSIFRIRSQTAPLGIMSSIDSEKIRVQVEPGDFVIMSSDGVGSAPEDAPWLLELISRFGGGGASDFADAILAEAKRRGRCADDITVTVMKIEEIA